jgi:hypothetical protein
LVNGGPSEGTNENLPKARKQQEEKRNRIRRRRGSSRRWRRNWRRRRRRNSEQQEESEEGGGQRSRAARGKGGVACAIPAVVVGYWRGPKGLGPDGRGPEDEVRLRAVEGQDASRPSELWASSQFFY